MNFLPVTLLLAIAASTVVQAAPADYPAAQYIAALQAKVAAVTARLNATQWPSSTAAAADSKYVWQASPGWTSGFFPGILWQLANYTRDGHLAQQAGAWTAGRAVEAGDNSTHDVGFMVFGSFGNGIVLSPTPPAGYQDIVFKGAHSLADRYSPIVGMTRSWGNINDKTQFQVIIDNLLNLEILLWTANNGGNQTYRDMAISHVDKTFAEWVRADGSTFHLVVFNPNNSQVISRSGTPQGMAVNSTWARGQSWGIYGFTMAYRYTKEQRFLDYARNVSEYYLAHAEADMVPKWDYDAPQGQYRDTSAAAIAASAFIELSSYLQDSRYYDAALSILSSLAGSYLASDDSEAMLAYNGHDCGSDKCTVIETDYYYLEALRRVLGAPF